MVSHVMESLKNNSTLLQLGSHFRSLTIIAVGNNNIVLMQFISESMATSLKRV